MVPVWHLQCSLNVVKKILFYKCQHRGGAWVGAGAGAGAEAGIREKSLAGAKMK